MNLRFKAETKDLVIFGIFAFFWLLVSMFIVANVSQFLNGEMLTINIFLSFMPKNILITLIVFFAGIVAAFIGVKSYFFERESGFGFTTTKKDKGYSRWAKEKEIQEELSRVPIKATNSKAAGVPLIIKEDEM